MEENKNFAPQEIWDSSYKVIGDNVKDLVDFNDAVTKWLYKYIPPVKDGEHKTVFEIGCYPGRYMYHFGKLGYELNGIDFSSELNENFGNWLKAEDFKVNDLVQQDIFAYNTANLYDVTASFGFIEHFSNFAELIKRHINLTKTGGIVIISVPDFANPFQYFFHRLTDKKLMDIHNLKAMKPAAWRAAVKEQNVEVIFDGYFGGFDFWYGEQQRNFFQKYFLKAMLTAKRIFLGKIKKNSSLYSPFYGMILIKK